MQFEPELRFFWICIFILSIYTCTVLTINIWKKWTYNPVIVSFAEKSTPVWEIPFPAVTICKERKFDVDIFNYTSVLERLDNITVDEKRYIETLYQICYREYFGFGKTFVNASDIIEVMDDLLIDSNPCYQMKWRNYKTNFNRFERVVTEDGICYTFNNLQRKDIYREEASADDDLYNYFFSEFTNYVFNKTPQWNMENGYDFDAKKDAYPFRVLRDGAKAGLFLALRDHFEYNAKYEGKVPGFKVLLHTPGEAPKVSEQYIPIPFDQVVIISIKPEIITTTEGLRHYDPMRRHCYFQHERHLRYFKAYTQSNCKLECLSNFTMERCGCVKFSMPRTVDTPVCGAPKLFCMLEAEDFLADKEFMENPREAEESFSVAKGCNCLPGCNSISYNAEISQGSIDWMDKRSEVSTKSTPFMKLYKYSALSIFFKEGQFLTSKRSELYGTADFLANCGGLLGLFMGVSTLSIVELVYFCTVRLLTNLRMRRRKRLELERVRSEEG